MPDVKPVNPAVAPEGIYFTVLVELHRRTHPELMNGDLAGWVLRKESICQRLLLVDALRQFCALPCLAKGEAHAGIVELADGVRIAHDGG